MGVADAERPEFRYLADELALLRGLVARDAPVLGICLGAQMLAAAAGARVYPNTRPGPDGAPVAAREVGWGQVDFIARDEPALAGLAARELVLHWHGDTFDLPRGAVHLASTPVCRHQAFRLGRRQFGLQFHCELAARHDRRLGAASDADVRARGAGSRRRRPHPGRHRALSRGRAAGLGPAARQHRFDHAIVNGVPSPQQFKLGLVQMRCSADPDDNLDARGRAHRARRPSAGASVVCLPELFRTQYFCQSEDHAHFDLAEPIPGPTHRGAARASRSETGVVVVGSLFERRAAGRLPQHRGRPRRRRLARAASTARCTSPTTRSTTRSSTSRPATSASRRSTPRSARVGTLVCWDQWYPEAARLTALRGRRGPLLPDRHRLASRREGRVRRGAARRLADRCSARTPSPTASSSRPSTASATRGRPTAGSSSGAASFVADPFGAILAEAGARPTRRS